MSLEDFNTIYSELIIDLRNRYSLNISLNDNASDKRYISHFIRNIIPYMDDISYMNLDALKYKHKNIFIVNGVKLSKILKSPMFIVDSRTLWKYFHALYVLCYKIPETKTLLKNYEDIENYNMISRNLEEYYYNTFLDNFKTVLTEKEDTDTDTDTETEEDAQVPTEEKKSTTETDAELPGFLQNSIIGNLAKEISSEIDTTQLENLENPADLFSSIFSGGAVGGGLGDLIGSVVGKLTEKMESGELDQTKLMTEAAGMMGSLNLFGGGGGGGETSMPTESTEPVETQTKTKSKKKKRRRKKKKNKVVSEES